MVTLPSPKRSTRATSGGATGTAATVVTTGCTATSARTSSAQWARACGHWWALKSGLHLKGSSWGHASNSAVFSRADSPTGVDFVCENNELAVSHLRDVRLNRSTFAHNDLNAASMQDVELNDSRMTGQHLRGSSIKGVLIEHGEVTDNHFNGAGLVNLAVSQGRLVGCHFNGAQVRDLGISASAMEASRFNGTKLRTIVLKADSLVKGLALNGVLGRNWLLEGGVVAEVQFRGVRVDGLVLKRSGIERVTFKTTDWSGDVDPSSLRLSETSNSSRDPEGL